MPSDRSALLSANGALPRPYRRSQSSLSATKVGADSRLSGPGRYYKGGQGVEEVLIRRHR